ncbi:MAG: DUF721 domain-containing protein [Flavobacteriales bacterium]|nr:DUF721 domain-containing protein [Flavobacteriales bacterium]
MKRKNEMKLSEAILFWMEKNGAKVKIQQIEIQQKWNELMSDSIVKQTKKIELSKNKATIYLTSPLIKTEFSQEKEKIKNALNSQLDGFELDELNFKLSNDFT